MVAEPLFERLCLIGVGLIGSSIARAARAKGGIARSIVAHTRRPETLARVRALDFADAVEADPARAVAGCDGVILCIPVGAYAGVMHQIAPHLAPGCILSDAGSTKGSVVRDLQPLLPPDDEINHVLDYRKVRQIIIDECTAEHVNLLETLIGKLTHRLMQLPGVAGTRIKIAKLEIFTDCEVAIRMEAGSWETASTPTGEKT